MKAVVGSEHGEPRVLKITQEAKPQPAPGQALIEVAAAGLNRADALQRRGYYPPPAGESSIYGLEVSGTVVEVGEGADLALVGRQVMALLASGGYAEYVAVDTCSAIAVPAGITLHEAAAFPEVAATVYSNLVMVVGLPTNPKDNAGKSVLVHGGSGGIGVHAIQLCKALGVQVFTTAGSAENAILPACWVRTLSTIASRILKKLLLKQPGVGERITFSMWWVAPTLKSICGCWR